MRDLPGASRIFARIAHRQDDVGSELRAVLHRRLGAADVEAGDGAAVMLRLGQLQGVGVVVGGVGQKLGLGVQTAQPNIVVGEDDMEAEATYSEAFDEGIILTHYRSKGCSLLE